jgi:hypothetical protein
VKVRIFAEALPSRWALCRPATRSEAVVKFVRYLPSVAAIPSEIARMLLWVSSSRGTPPGA